MPKSEKQPKKQTIKIKKEPVKLPPKGTKEYVAIMGLI
jgi:hypothetical protein